MALPKVNPDMHLACVWYHGTKIIPVSLCKFTVTFTKVEFVEVGERTFWTGRGNKQSISCDKVDQQFSFQNNIPWA